MAAYIKGERPSRKGWAGRLIKAFEGAAVTRSKKKLKKKVAKKIR